MIRRPPRSTPQQSSAASDVYKRQLIHLNLNQLQSFLITWKSPWINLHPKITSACLQATKLWQSNNNNTFEHNLSAWKVHEDWCCVPNSEGDCESKETELGVLQTGWRQLSKAQGTFPVKGQNQTISHSGQLKVTGNGQVSTDGDQDITNYLLERQTSLLYLLHCKKEKSTYIYLRKYRKKVLIG